MPLFHDEEDGPDEPVRGLPAELPEGEDLIWQGGASPRSLGVHAFHVRSVAIYFAAAVVIRLAFSVGTGASAMEALQTVSVIAGLGMLAVGVLWLMAWGMAKRVIFSITNKRVVIRHGVGIRKYVNVPFASIETVAMKRHSDGSGDIALQTDKTNPIPYFHLWPFARPFRFTRTVPLMRAIPEPQPVAETLVTAMKDYSPTTVRVGSADPAASEGHASPAAAGSFNAEVAAT